MDQNQTIDNQTVGNPAASTSAADSASVDNDLQKAIDNITNTTSVDPVFSDPVAAPSSVPEGDTGELGEPVGPFPTPEPEPEPEPKVETVEQKPEPIAPLESMNIPELNNFDNSTSESAPSQPLNTSEVKKAALRDLLPLLDKTNMTGSEKFKIYRDVFDDLKDYTALESAYQVTHDISDETERANALLYLVKSIDNM